MRGSKTKKLRKAVFKGKDPRHRTYSTMEKTSPTGKKYYTGARVADDARTFYQAMKKLYSKGVRFEEV